MLNISESISFQDVLLIPKHNSYSGNISTEISINRGEIEYAFSQPLVPSNSFLITDVKMAISLITKNSLAIFHDGFEYYRLSYSEVAIKANLLKSLREIRDICLNFINRPDFLKFLGFTVGAEDYDTVQELYNQGVRIFCVEHIVGDSDAVLAMVDFIRKLDNQNLIIAGNVVTGKAAKSLWITGADIVKCGFGASSRDNTRENTGCGVPQLSALIDCAAEKSRGQYLLSNGGVNTPGDVVKALCFADFVMSQRLFETSFEAPSSNAKFSVDSIITSILKEVMVGCRMQNVANLRALQEDVSMVRLTSSGILEGRLI